MAKLIAGALPSPSYPTSTTITVLHHPDHHCSQPLPSHLHFSYIQELLPTNTTLTRDHEGRHLPVAARRSLSSIRSSSATSQTPKASQHQYRWLEKAAREPAGVPQRALGRCPKGLGRGRDDVPQVIRSGELSLHAQATYPQSRL